MRFLVTGGSGFIGQHLLYLLNQKGHETSNLDLKPCAGYTCVQANILDKSSLERALDQTDGVFHLAALTSVAESFEKPAEYLKTNVEGTINLIQSAAKQEVGKILIVSSAAVYGETNEKKVKEDTPFSPKSPYASTKAAQEFFAKNLCENLELNYSIVRPFNVYGEGQEQNNPYTGVITRFLSLASEGKKLPIYGDGEQTRDFVYVRDVAEAMIHVYEKGEKKAYNIGTGKGTTVNQLAEKISKNVVHLPERTGEIRHSVADINRLKKIGFEPKTSLVEGLEKISPKA